MNYALHVYNAAGVKQAVITDFQRLSYIRRVNWPGALWFTLVGDHPILSSIADKWRIKVMRQREDKTWDEELWALHRDEQWVHHSDGDLFSSYSQGLKTVLAQRIVNWSTGYSDRSSFVSEKGETIMNTLVKYNAASSATVANGRKRDGVIANLTVETDGTDGNTIDWRCHGDNLLQTLFDLAIPAGGDFDLVATSSSAMEFRFYDGQLGSDLSASVLFSMENANMANPQYQLNRSSERTVACVWGKGEKDDRDYVTRTGTNYHTADNDIETYVDAKSVDKGDTDGLNSKGDLSLDKSEAKDNFTFSILQSDGYKYREDYNLGDLVKAKNPFTGISQTMQVKTIAVRLNENGDEKVEVELEPQ